jgi:hypothetical protein
MFKQIIILIIMISTSQAVTVSTHIHTGIDNLDSGVSFMGGNPTVSLVEWTNLYSTGMSGIGKTDKGNLGLCIDYSHSRIGYQMSLISNNRNTAWASGICGSNEFLQISSSDLERQG